MSPSWPPWWVCLFSFHCPILSDAFANHKIHRSERSKSISCGKRFSWVNGVFLTSIDACIYLKWRFFKNVIYSFHNYYFDFSLAVFSLLHDAWDWWGMPIFNRCATAISAERPLNKRATMIVGILNDRDALFKNYLIVSHLQSPPVSTIRCSWSTAARQALTLALCLCCKVSCGEMINGRESRFHQHSTVSLQVFYTVRILQLCCDTETNSMLHLKGAECSWLRKYMPLVIIQKMDRKKKVRPILSYPSTPLRLLWHCVEDDPELPTCRTSEDGPCIPIYFYAYGGSGIPNDRRLAADSVSRTPGPPESRNSIIMNSKRTTKVRLDHIPRVSMRIKL